MINFPDLIDAERKQAEHFSLMIAQLEDSGVDLVSAVLREVVECCDRKLAIFKFMEDHGEKTHADWKAHLRSKLS